MNRTQIPTAHHDLSFGGWAPWPVPGMLSMDDVRQDPAARCCQECGRRVLLLLLQSSSWVSHRAEHVSFRDDRSVVRRVTVEFHVPEQDVPVFCGDDGQAYSLVPLSVMRRKTLVNFELRDDAGRSVVVPTLRQNQAITESMLLACADAAIERADTASGGDVADFVHQVISGDQQGLRAAYKSLECGTAAPAVLRLAEHKTFRAVLDRMADNFVLWVMIPVGTPRRRKLTFSCDEPLDPHYREPGYEKDEGKYKLGDKLRAWHPRVWCSALGLTTTRIRFPVPAAENAASFHFEVDAPKGVQVVEASLLAGRPQEPDPSFDQVKGGFVTVGLHVIEVPNGSLSRAQIGLQVLTRGWLTTSTVASWAVFGFLLAFAMHHAVLSPSKTEDFPVLILVALAGVVAGAIAQSDAKGLAAYLLRWTRALATVAAILPLVATTFIAFEAVQPSHLAPALWTAAVASGVIATLLSAVCVLSWHRQRQTVRSPWEQSRDRGDMPERPKSFQAAARKHHYDKPAVRVDTAEGWHTEFDWDSAGEDQLITALVRQSSAVHGPVPRRCLVMAR
jgi:hypothetical protein